MEESPVGVIFVRAQYETQAILTQGARAEAEQHNSLHSEGFGNAALSGEGKALHQAALLRD
jgi:hypothetical protein